MGRNLRGARKTATCISIVTAFFAVPISMGCQSSALPELRPGARVRFVLQSGATHRTGTVVDVQDSVVSVRPERESFPIVLAWDSLASFVIGEPRSAGAGARHGAWVGFRTGAVITVVGTLATVLSDADENCMDCFISATPVVIALGMVATAGLTVGGALLGAAAPGETWTGPDMVRVRARGQRGTGLTLAVSWRLVW
jgi:hypothetical protein